MPASLASLHFEMADGRKCKIEERRDGGTIWYSVSAWEKGAKTGKKYKEFPVFVSDDPIDPYIVYRLIEPAYESWHDMGIYQRELASFKEKAIVTNKVNDKGCLNCHSFPSGDPQSMIFHARGKGGGTVFVNAGAPGVHITNLANVGPKMQGTYPAWSPDGRYVVFSSNTTNQSFYAAAGQPIEVYDTTSDMILMDLESGEVSIVAQTEGLLETFPSWSADGTRLYYCVADDPGNLPISRGDLRYKLMSLSFENGRFIGEPDTLIDVDSLSISHPREKNGRIMFTASGFGTFPIWHAEADLWLIDLKTGDMEPATTLNSEDTESYHSWSSNGKWVIFSSRRLDGRFTRLFISHCEDDGSFSKPFLLPQKNPEHNTLRLKSYNIPEFVKGPVPDIQGEIAKLF